jgi:transcriptional regulator with XRE-family HTH domain
MARKPVPLSAQLRAAIDASEMSRYQICKLIGLSEATMSRFMAGKGGLSIETLDRLGECLGLELAVRETRGKKSGG